MFQANQQIGVYTLVEPIKRNDLSEVWVARMRDTSAHTPKDILWLIEFGQVNGQIVILSEYPGGDSLAEKLKNQDKFSTEQAIKLTIEILDGLDQLHKKGIIHGKLNPRNIFLQNETPILADFGVTDDSDSGEKIPFQGGIPYLAPEALNRVHNVQTDIWSVGVILYQLLSGKLPFPQELPLVIFAIVKSEFSPLPDEMSGWLKMIIGCALAKNPKSRYQSTVAMREDLRMVLDSIKNSASQPTLNFLRPTYPKLMYPGSLVVHGIERHGVTGGGVWEVTVAFDSQETVVAFYEEKFGKGQVKSDYGAVAVEWTWEDNLGSLNGYKRVSVYSESSRALFTEQHRIKIPANTKAICSIESSHW